MSTPPPPPPPPGPYGSGLPPSPGGPGAPPATPAGPAPASTPPPAKGGGAGKVALVGTALVVVIGGFSVIRLFGGGGDAPTPDPTPTAVASAEPTADPNAGPTEATPTEGPTPEPESTEGSVLPAANEQETPGSTSVEGLVEAEVGEWRLVDAVELPEWIELGASSALRTQYKNPKNFNVRHIVAAFPSPADAVATADDFVVALEEEEGTELLTEFPVVIDDEEVGGGYFFTHKGGHLVLYTNGAILSTIAATRRASVIDFYQNVPY